MRGTNDELISTGRLEGFSDGVFAIAMTVLIIEVHIEGEGGSVVNRLCGQWPSYAGFLISFVTIGVMWINHHAISKVIRRVDDGVLVANSACCSASPSYPSRPGSWERPLGQPPVTIDERRSSSTA